MFIKTQKSVNIFRSALVYIYYYLNICEDLNSVMMATAYPASYSAGCYPQVEQPLKWILTSHSNSYKHSENSSTLALLLNHKETIKNMSTPITRTNFKQQLQRQQLEQQDQIFQAAQKIGQPDQPQSQSIAVPRTASPTTVPPDVPSSVLQVGSIFLLISFTLGEILYCTCRWWMILMIPLKL